MEKIMRQIFVFALVVIFSQSFFVFVAGAQIQPPLESYYSDSDVPIVLPRSIWDNTPELHALMVWQPQTQNGNTPSDWQPVERIVIHDTGCDPKTNPTCNNNIDPIATIQAIYRYHAVTRGWGDIGYNYIIDQQGRIYEGRYGGNGSRAAHLYIDRTEDNFNYGTIGISILGNYATRQPSEAVYASLARLVGWLCTLNGLDPQGQTSSYVWNRQKNNFQTFFSGATILGHKDIEKGNPDPGLLDFSRVRQEAAIFANKFKNFIYQRGGDSKFYQVIRGTRQIFSDLATVAAQGVVYGQIVSLPAAQLDLFSETRFLKYPDGSLVQIKGNPSVYLIEGGKKRIFSVTAKQFAKLGFDFAGVRQVTADELLNYSDGNTIKFGIDGELISDGAKVYFIENGKKRWVISGNLFKALGYKWSKVKTDAVLVLNLLDGAAMTYPDGTLFREKDSQIVYLMEGGQKHQFVSAQSFLRLGYKWEKVINLDSIEVSLTPTGSIMTYASGTLIKAENNPNVYLVDKSLARLFISSEIFLNLGYKWSKILEISSSEMSFYSLGEPVRYSENTLLRPKDRNNVYLISGGKPIAIDGATFKKRNYKWANVLVISAEDFGVLYEGKAVQSAIPAVTPSPLSAPTASPVPVQTPSSAPSLAPIESPASAVTPKVRIGIFAVDSSSVTLSADTDYDVLNKSGQVIISKKAGESFVYNIAVAAEAFVKIKPRSFSGVVEIVSYDDHPAWKPTLNYNRFRGSVEIIYSAKSAKVWAVNEVDLEDYLKGIAETSEGDPTEYLKTMTVAARTYAYYYILKGGKRGTDEVYQLLNTTADQLYKGYSREVVAPSIVSAVSATRGEIAVYNNQPIVAAYSSGAPELMSSGTKSACSLWASQYCQVGFEYLAGGAKDPAGTAYSQTACGGANHCVGLSGAGTRQFAKTGAKNYQEILKHYYPGITIRKYY